MKLKEKANAKPTISVVEGLAPKCLISHKALGKMWTYIDECSDEIGWLGTATRNKNIITIDDVFLFDQEVHSTTTEITPDGLAKFGMEILNMPNGTEMWNNMRVWGHSHVRMQVTPSAQDNNQMKTFAECGLGWFIRIIANKHGDMKVDLYDYDNGIVFFDLAWEAELTEEEVEIYNTIDALYEEIDNIRAAQFVHLVPDIKEEMKLKVRKKTYQSAYKGNNVVVTGFKNEKKTPTTTATTIGNQTTTQENGTKSYSQDVIDKYDDVFIYFDEQDLKEIAMSNNIFQVKETVSWLGYYNHFSTDDLYKIWNVANKYNNIVEEEDDDYVII